MPLGRTPPTFYRVFQHCREPGLCCAVRGTMLIPHFVRAGRWCFGANFREDDGLPFGFEPAAAREASAAFGYYLFHHPSETLAPRHCRHWSDGPANALGTDSSGAVDHVNGRVEV